MTKDHETARKLVKYTKCLFGNYIEAQKAFISKFHKIPYVPILGNIVQSIRNHASWDKLHCLSSKFRLLTTYTCDHRPDWV